MNASRISTASVAFVAAIVVALSSSGCTSTAPSREASSSNSPPPSAAASIPRSAASPSSAAPPSASPAAHTIGQAADDGARVVAVESVDARTRDLTIDSPSVGVQKARLVLPVSFDTRPTVLWPVFYFLHTANDTEPYLNNSYVTRAPAPKVLEGYSKLDDTLVVVPEGGAWGWYSDWWNDGKGGPPMWETFQLQEVRQLIERNWRAGDRRVVVGASMGGYGAIEYATRHPELFVGAASISGPLSVIGRDDPEMDSAWGDPVAQAAVWLTHDPLHHVAALQGTGITLFISYGDGRPAPPDDPAGPIDDTEAGIADGDDAFVARLKSLGVPATVHAFGPGHHLQFFDREFERAVNIMAKALGDGN